MGEMIGDCYNPPAWAVGRITQEDAFFLAEMVLLVSSGEVIEVGVASGCSSAVLLRAINRLPGDRRLYSFDIMHQCYFAPERAVGAAVAEMAPDLADGWELFCGEGASDAARRFEGRDIKFAFIDADHRHPWPTLDLLALLPALSEDAWVVLHDIVLPQISEFKVYGASYLYDAWPGEKRAAAGVGNIGALRLPGDRAKAEAWLRDVLRTPWETSVPVSLLRHLHLQLNNPCARRVEEVEADGRMVMVWGAGGTGRACMKELRDAGFNPAGFIDSDSEKEGADVDGCHVYGPQFLMQSTRRPFVVVASMFAPEIEAALFSHGFVLHTDFLRFTWVGDEVSNGLMHGDA